MSSQSVNDNPLLSEKRCSSSCGTKESKECDVLASDVTRSTSKWLSKSESPPPESYGSSSNKERVWSVAACSLTACLAALVNVGMMLGFSSPALKQLQYNVSEEFQLSSTDIKYSLFGVGSSNKLVAYLILMWHLYLSPVLLGSWTNWCCIWRFSGMANIRPPRSQVSTNVQWHTIFRWLVHCHPGPLGKGAKYFLWYSTHREGTDWVL